MQTVARIRADDLLATVRERLKIPAITNPLGVAGDVQRASRVYAAGDAIPAMPEGKLFGRVIVTPREQRVSLNDTDYALTRPARFLVVVEFAPWQGQGWRPGTAIAAIHEQVARQLDGWQPPPLAHAQFYGPIMLDLPAPLDPLRAPDTEYWYASAEYLADLAPLPLIP